jgi:hypothetical protein
MQFTSRISWLFFASIVILTPTKVSDYPAEVSERLMEANVLVIVVPFPSRRFAFRPV